MSIERLGLIAFAIFVVGCHTQGAYLPAEQATEIQTEIKTAKDLQAKLGNPTVTVPIPPSKTMWVYDGMKSRVGATTFIPYLNYLIATEVQKCTHLTVLVDNQTGELSDWKYSSAKDLDNWLNTDDTCEDKKAKDKEAEETK